jgi:2-isopropylmalate synthase
MQVANAWVLKDLQVVCGTMGMPTATVKLQAPDGLTSVVSAVGLGPVDAAYKAVDSVIDVDAELVDYTVTSVTAGIDSVATTRVRPCGHLSPLALR